MYIIVVFLPVSAKNKKFFINYTLRTLKLRKVSKEWSRKVALQDFNLTT